MTESVALFERQAWSARHDHVSAARHFVADRLSEWRVPAAVDSAVLVVSELSTNAVIHAQTSFSVHVSWNGEVVLVQVTDGSPAPPAINRTESGTPGGRGLVVVDAVAEQWGSIPLPHGKTVWATLVTAEGPDSAATRGA